ncbi:hypothetical protein GMMP15_1070010 [Candidatus Magnetomoraceae bacterium gMMP-15]
MNNADNRIDHSMHHRRTLIIGLGGVGTFAARHSCEWIKELCGLTGRDDLPDFIKIISFDTDPQRGKTPQPLQNNLQFFYIGGFAAGHLIRATKKGDYPKYLKDFKGRGLRPGQIHTGAHGIPLIGRLCYAYKHNIVLSALNKAILQLLDPSLPFTVKQKYDLELEPTGIINVHIISSVCGGTGAGILLDTACDVIKLVHEHSSLDPYMIGHLVLPPVFTGTSGLQKDQHERNTYYILKQVDHLIGGKDRIDINTLYADDQKGILYKENTLFNGVYLINRPRQSKAETERTLGRIIAAFSMEPIGGEIHGKWDNLRDICIPNQKAYLGLGLTTFRPLKEEQRELFLKDLSVNNFKAFIEEKFSIKPSNGITISNLLSKIEKLFSKVTDEAEIKDIQDKELVDIIKNIEGIAQKTINEHFWKIITYEIEGRGNIELILQFLKNTNKIRETNERIRQLKQELNIIYNDDNDDESRESNLEEKCLDLYKHCFQKNAMDEFHSKQDIIAGKQLKNLIDYCIDKFNYKNFNDKSKSARILNRNLAELIKGESGHFNIMNLFNEHFWIDKYISLVEKLVINRKESKDKEIISDWFEKEIFKSDKFEQKRDNFTREVLLHNLSQKNMKLYFEKANLKTDLLIEVISKPNVDKTVFAQVVNYNKDDELEEFTGFQICTTDENCDWGVSIVFMGCSLKDIKNLNNYKEKFQKALDTQRKLWIQPLIKMTEKEDDDFYKDQLWKIKKD